MDKIGSLLKQKRLEKGLTIEAVSEKNPFDNKTFEGDRGRGYFLFQR